jgi:putative ABC transport system permease protein
MRLAAGFASATGDLFPVFRVSGTAVALLVGLVAAAWSAWKMSRVYIVGGLCRVA